MLIIIYPVGSTFEYENDPIKYLNTLCCKDEDGLSFHIQLLKASKISRNKNELLTQLNKLKSFPSIILMDKSFKFDIADLTLLDIPQYLFLYNAQTQQKEFYHINKSPKYMGWKNIFIEDDKNKTPVVYETYSDSPVIQQKKDTIKPSLAIRLDIDNIDPIYEALHINGIGMEYVLLDTEEFIYLSNLSKTDTKITDRIWFIDNLPEYFKERLENIKNLCPESQGNHYQQIPTDINMVYYEYFKKHVSCSSNIHLLSKYDRTEFHNGVIEITDIFFQDPEKYSNSSICVRYTVIKDSHSKVYTFHDDANLFYKEPAGLSKFKGLMNCIRGIIYDYCCGKID